MKFAEVVVLAVFGFWLSLNNQPPGLHRDTTAMQLGQPEKIIQAGYNRNIRQQNVVLPPPLPLARSPRLSPGQSLAVHGQKRSAKVLGKTAPAIT
jgi:hypothetical protein